MLSEVFAYYFEERFTSIFAYYFEERFTSNFSLRSIEIVMKNLLNPAYSIEEFCAMRKQGDDNVICEEEIAKTMLTNILKEKILSFPG